MFVLNKDDYFYSNQNSFSIDKYGEIIFKCEENQYLFLLKRILEQGELRDDNKTHPSLSVFGTKSVYSLKNNTFPLLTTKKMFYKGVFEELMWFLRGSTNGNDLLQKNVSIWKMNGEKNYPEKIGFKDRKEHDLGPIYGFQWRHFGAEYKTADYCYKGEGVDQIANIINLLKTNPNSRRILFSAWNPKDLDKMVLPPCHILAQFRVNNEKELECTMYQRSGDMGLGVPFNIASYSLLIIMLAHVTGLKPGKLIHIIGDTHIYKDHVEQVKEQIKRTPEPFPKLCIKEGIKRENINDFQLNDFELVGYSPHPAIEMRLLV